MRNALSAARVAFRTIGTCPIGTPDTLRRRTTPFQPVEQEVVVRDIEGVGRIECVHILLGPTEDPDKRIIFGSGDFGACVVGSWDDKLH